MKKRKDNRDIRVTIRDCILEGRNFRYFRPNLRFEKCDWDNDFIATDVRIENINLYISLSPLNINKIYIGEIAPHMNQTRGSSEITVKGINRFINTYFSDFKEVIFITGFGEFDDYLEDTGWSRERKWEWIYEIKKEN